MPSQKTPKPAPKKQKAIKNMDGGDYVKIMRSQLQEAEYNPRVIDKYAAMNLRKSIQESGGLVQPIIWNSQTGNIVGGHQRIHETDQIAGYAVNESGITNDYELTVCQVNVTELQEKQLNIRLNNPNNQGTYAPDLLFEVLQDITNDDFGMLEGTGFDVSSLQMYADSVGLDMSAMLNIPEDPLDSEVLMDVASTMDESDLERLRQKEQDKIDLIKKRKQEFADRAEFHGQVRFFAVLVFPTDSTKAQFMAGLNLPPEIEYVSGVDLANLLNIPLEIDGPPADEDEQTIPETLEEPDNKPVRKSKKKKSADPA